VINRTNRTSISGVTLMIAETLPLAICIATAI
jgi:hypothetical protein